MNLAPEAVFATSDSAASSGCLVTVSAQLDALEDPVKLVMEMDGGRNLVCYFLVTPGSDFTRGKINR